MLHFWLIDNCIIKSFLDTASFVGSNKTGILFSAVLGLLSLAQPIRAHVKQHGWPRMSKEWIVLLRRGITNSAIAFSLVWILHLVAAPYGLYTEVEAQKKQSVQECAKEQKRLSGDIS